MVSTLTWVLSGVLLYTVVALLLRQRGLLPDYIKLQGPIATIHTKRGKKFLNWLAKPKRFWRAWGNFGVGMAVVVMVSAFFVIMFSAYQSLTSPTANPVQSPQNVLVIPGVNDFLPLSSAPDIIFGLLVGLVVHEGGHGLLCRVEDIDIKSMGVAMLAVIPIGAFVEPDEESREKAGRGAQTRMFAAGVTNNFAITAVAFLLLFGPIAGSIAVAPGVPVGTAYEGSPADAAGLAQGDRITAIEGQAVANESELQAVLADTDARTVQVSLAGREDPVALERRLLLTSVIPSLTEGIDAETGDPPVVESVNGTAVSTRSEFLDLVRNRTVVEIGTNKGSATLPIGLYVVQQSGGGPLDEAGVPTDADVIITRVAGERVVTVEDLRTVLDGRIGDTVEVEVNVDGTADSYNVTVGESDDGRPILGFAAAPLSGLELDAFGIDVYPASAFLGILGGGDGEGGLGGTFLERMFTVLLLPFLAIIPALPFGYNFAGFVGPVANFYTVVGPLGFLGGGVFTLANLMFWTGWVNLQLGFFNCIPAFPLDGGHILRTSTEAIVSRLPVEKARSATSAVTVSIGLTMLAGLILMIFGPQLLS